PTFFVFAAVVALLVRAHQPPADRPRAAATSAPLSMRQGIRRVVSTIAGGYLVFAVLTAFFYWLGGQSGALIGQPLLAVLLFTAVGVVPFFAVTMALDRGGRARRRI